MGQDALLHRLWIVSRVSLEVSIVDITTQAGANNINEVWCPIARGRLRNVFQKLVTERIFLEVRVAHQVGGSA